MENRQIVIPIPSRVRAPSKEQRTTNSQQAPNSAPLVQTKEFKPQAKHHFLPVNPMEDSAELHLLDCEEALSDDEISRNAQEQATTSCDDRKRTRSADAQDVHHPKQKKHAPAAVEEPDPANPYAPSLASVLECFRLLVEREDILQPSSDFIMEEALITTPGCGITERKRATLMRWVLEVSESFGLNHCTSGHVLSLIDRTLEKLPVRRHLALIGLACLLIGSKFVEIHPVAVDELQRCAPIYTTADILKMEKNVLETLNWDLKVVTVSEMSRCVSSQLPAGCRKRVTQLSELLIDLAQSEADPIWWLGQRRSSLALGVVLASLNICGTCFPNFKQFVDVVDEKAVQKQCGEFLDLYQANLKDRTTSPQNTMELVKPAAFEPKKS